MSYKPFNHHLYLNITTIVNLTSALLLTQPFHHELLRRKQELLIRYNPLQGLSTEDRVTATAKRVGLSSPTGYVKGQEFGRGWAVKDESENGGGNEEGGR
jgi:hypothetical protein